MGSTAGTQVNGVPLKNNHAVPLSCGDSLTLGQTTLQLVDQVSVKGQLLAETGCCGDEELEGGVESTHHVQIPETRRLFTLLTPAELEVVLWMMRGCLNDEELGQQLFRSPHTVRTQIGSIFQKVGIHSRAELISLLLRRA